MKIVKAGSLFLVLLCFALSAYWGIEKHSFLSAAVVADAQIVEMLKSPDADDEYVTPVLEYAYNGSSHKVVNPFMIDDAQYKLKQIVPVIIDPLKPEVAQMKTAAFQYYPSMLGFLMGLLSLIIYLLVFPPRFKKSI